MRSVIRADKGPIDFVIQGILEIPGETGRKRIVIRSDSEPAVKALVQAVALHRGRDGDRHWRSVLVTTFLCCMQCTRGYSGTVAGFSTVSVSAGTVTQHKGRIHNGEVCGLFECVLFKVPSAEEAKLDDRFRLGVWIGKT